MSENSNNENETRMQLMYKPGYPFAAEFGNVFHIINYNGNILIQSKWREYVNIKTPTNVEFHRKDEKCITNLSLQNNE